MEKCREQVREKGMWPRFHRCKRNAVKDGKCLQHHPDTIDAKAEKRLKEWRAKIHGSRIVTAQERIEELRKQIESLMAENAALTSEICRLKAKTGEAINVHI